MPVLAPPPPPRYIGDPRIDLPAAFTYMAQLHQMLVREGYFLQTEKGTGLIGEASAAAAAARTAADGAQSTATAAQTTATTAASRLVASGQIVIEDADTSKVVTFGVAQANTSYQVVLTKTDEAGTPAAGSGTVTSVGKTTADFTVNIGAAPGVGNSVTFDYFVTRSA